jgi:PAS domain S-box-containing protein
MTGFSSLSWPKVKILLIDDDEDDFLITKEICAEIEGLKPELDWVSTYAEGREAIKRQAHDVYLIDHRLPDGSGIDLLREANEAGFKAPMIILTGLGDHEVDLQAMAAGAADFLVKSQINASLLERSIRYSIERARNLHALHESEERYRILVETSPDAVVFIDPTGRILFCNKQSSTLLDAERPDILLGRLIKEFIVPEDWNKFQETLNSLFESNAVKTVEFTMISLTGRQFPAEASINQIPEHKSYPRGIIIVIRDITERKLAESALRIEETRTRALLMLSQMTNRAESEIFNYTLEYAVALTKSTRAFLFQTNNNGGSFIFWPEIPQNSLASIYKSLVEEIKNNPKITTKTFIHTDSNPGLPPKELSFLCLPIIDSGNVAIIIGVNGNTNGYSQFEERQLAVIADGMWKTIQRKRSDEAVRKLTLAVEQAADHLIVTDKNGVIEYVNPAFEKITGYSKSEALGKTPRILKSGLHTPEFYKDLWDTILSGSVFRTVFINKRKNGEIYYQEETITPIFDSSNQITHFLSTGRDITERKKAEEALQKAEAKYRSIFENAIEGIFQTTPDGKFITANPALINMLGYVSFDDLSNNIQSIYNDLYVDNSRGQELLELLEKYGQVSNFESKVYRKDKSIIWISKNARAIKDESGKIIFIEGTIENITHRKRAEQAIKKLAAFPQLNPNPIFEFAADGSLTYFNQAAEKMAKEHGQRHVSEVIPQEIINIIKDCINTGKSLVHKEISVGRKTYSWSFFPIPAENCVHCYAEDITDWLNLQEQLRQSQKMESIGRLAAGVAHDFNNLLTIIQGQVCLLLNQPDLSPKLLRGLNQVESATERAANLTRQLLAFSRRQILQPKLIDLNEVITNVSKMLNRLIGEDIKMEFHFSAQLPPVYADVGMIEQVIMNLAINSRDAMPNGGKIIVETSLVNIDESYVKFNPEAKPGHHVCLSVTDTGVGMPPEVLEHLFEPFFTTKETGKGTGLGLATVYGIVTQHKGWIEVQSKVNQGSTFKVFLPGSVKAATTPVVETGPEIIRGGNESILIAEDDPTLRSLIKEILESYGYKAHESGTGREALELWEKLNGNVDLLLTDLVMPDGLSGRKLAEQLLAKKPHLKVIYTTGYSTEVAQQDLTLVAGLNFLQKPFNPRTLAKLVRNALDSP